MTRFAVILSLILSTLLLGLTPAAACPLIDGLVDYNCDGKIRIAFTGDSLVKGVADEQGLGYPGRLARRIANVEVENIGVPGTTPRRLRRDFIRNLPLGKVTAQKSEDLDYMVIQVGTNSYWDDQPPSFVIRDLKRLKKTLEQKLAEMFTVAPLIFVTTLPPTRRDYQQPFIDEVNTLLLRKGIRKALRVKIRIDNKLSVEKHVSDDNLHLNGKGYEKIAKLMERKLFNRFPSIALKSRHDEDRDNLYDELELLKFSTDPLVTDTDGDSLSDGDEVFIFKTNPLNIDTDGDDITDSAEITEGTDPLVPEVLS